MRNLKRGFDLIKEFEGLYLKAYLDPVNIPTIGWGTITYPDGRKVKMGDEITREQAEEYLQHHAQSYIQALESAVKVPVNDHQFGALLSWTYNVGPGAMQRSTLLRVLNQGDYLKAADELLRWNKAGGKVLRGLSRRREAERKLFLEPVETASAPAQEAEEDALVIETPEWFDAFKVIIQRLFDAVFGPKQQEKRAASDEPDTGAPAKATYSDGEGPRITRERVMEILSANGANLSQVNLLVIRGYYLDTYGSKGVNDRGVYDDACIWYWVQGFRTFKGNADPSIYRNGFGTGASKGVANLKKGRWPGYFPGRHNGSAPHEAFRQGRPVTVIRDGTPPYEDTGMFGINVHRGGSRGTSSLGCITLPVSTWETFKALGDQILRSNSQREFDLVLVHETDLRDGKLKA